MKLRRVNLWLMVALNSLLVLALDGLAIAIGTPIWATSYTYWLLALALIVTIGMGHNIIRLFNFLVGRGYHG